MHALGGVRCFALYEHTVLRKRCEWKRHGENGRVEGMCSNIQIWRYILREEEGEAEKGV
jgi:hypothetical protein